MTTFLYLFKNCLHFCKKMKFNMNFKKDFPTQNRVGGIEINFENDAFPAWIKDFNQK